MSENEKFLKHTAVDINPFNNLKTPKNIEAIDQGFRNKYIIPIYMNLLGMNQYKRKLKRKAKNVVNDINEEIVSRMLGDFNWRTRSTGAFFSAIKGYSEFQGSIGNLLLKSEVTYAGESYCLTLAEFNNSKSIYFLNEYLDYYLTKPDLWFDQNHAMGALAYLDKLNGTDELDKHLGSWNKFVSNKPNWELGESIEWFEKNLSCLKEIKKHVS
jgi:hypothetical protein